MINAASDRSLVLDPVFVTRKPLFIFSRIKNASVKNGKKKELNQLLETLRRNLPKSFKIGVAVGEGDCFFDSVAQGLNGLKSKDLITDGRSFNVKTLREDCANCANKYEDKIIRDANQGGYFVAQKNLVYTTLGPIQGRNGDNVPDKEKTFDKYLKNIKKTAGVVDDPPIWGRNEIEGKMICEKYGVKIMVIELRDKQVDGVFVTTDEQGEGSDVIYIVNYSNHFVPLLHNLEKDIEECVSVSREEVYGKGTRREEGLVVMLHEEDCNPDIRQVIMDNIKPSKRKAASSSSENGNKVANKSSKRVSSLGSGSKNIVEEQQGSDLSDCAGSPMIVEGQLSKSYRENHLSSDDDIKGAKRSPSISSSSPMSTDQEERARPVNMSSNGIESKLEKLRIIGSLTDKVVQTSRESLPLQNPFSLRWEHYATGADVAVSQKKRGINQVDSSCDNPKAKKGKISFHSYKSRTSREEFVKNFVREFENELKGCYDKIRESKGVKQLTLLSARSPKIGLIGEPIAAGVAAGVGLLGASVPVVIGIAATAMVLGKCTDHLINKAAGFFGNRKAAKKAAKVTNAGYNYEVDYAKIRKVLVKAGVGIFLHYEHQYTRVKDKKVPRLTMELLARDAVKRIMNYIGSQKDSVQGEDPEAFLKNFHTLITKGIVLGDSEKIESQFTFTDKKENFNIKDMYAQVGLVRVTDTDGGEANEYYTKESKTNVEKYGYRAAFEWESENVPGEWKKQEDPPQIQYQYDLKPEEIEEKASKILEKIDEGEPVVKRDIAKLESNIKKTVNLLLAKKQGLEFSVFDCPLQLAVKENDLKIVQYLIGGKGVNYNVKNLYEGHDLFQLAAENNSLEVLEYLIKVCEQCFDYEIKVHFQYKPLQLAAINDSLEVLEYLINNKLSDYKMVDDLGYNLFQLAAMSGSMRVFRYLIDKKYFNYDMVDGEGNNIFYYAVRCDSLEVLEYLIRENEKYFNDSIKNDEGYSLLRLASENDSIEVLAYLIKKRNLNYQLKEDRGYNLLHIACENDSVNVLKYLRGENFSYELKKDGGYNLLCTSAKNNSISVIKYLMEQRCYNHQFDDDGGYNLLFIAVKYDSVEVLECLIGSQLFNCCLEERRVRSLFHGAVKNASMKVLKYLIKNKFCNFEIKDDILYILLKLADEKDSLEDFKFLLYREEVDINTTNAQGYSLLHLAAKEGCLDIVKLLVERGANISIRDRSGKTPKEVAVGEVPKFLDDTQTRYNGSLFRAFSKKNSSTIKKMLDLGADIDTQDKNEKTLLHLAAEEGCLDIVELLVKREANISIQDNNGKTPLDLANECGKTKVANFLTTGCGKYDKCLFNPAKSENLSMGKGLLNNGGGINAEYNDGRTSLHLAAKEGDIKVVRSLIEKGAKVDIQDNKKKTLLHLAAKNGHFDVAIFLISNRAKVDIQDNKKKTPLHLAAENGHFDVADFLIKKGAKVDIQDNKKKTPLHLAAENNRMMVVQLLVSSNANINAQDSDGRTSLHLAAKNGHINAVYLLVCKGAGTNVQDKNGKTPLCLAATNSYKAEHSTIVQLLLSVQDNYNQNLFLAVSSKNLDRIKYLLSDNRTSITTQNKNGKTSLHLAAENGSLEVVRFLFENGANIHTRDKNGKTPLHLAAENGSLEVVRFLFENGANIHTRDKNGKTPLHLAVENRYDSIVFYLVEGGASIRIQHNGESFPLRLSLSNSDEAKCDKIIEFLKGKEEEYDELLLLAASRGYVDRARVALNKGANVNAENDGMLTPLCLAVNGEHLGVVTLLVNRGCDIDAQGKDKCTALHTAASQGYTSIVEFLLSRGASVTIENSQGKTPLDLVLDKLNKNPESKKYKEIRDLLVVQQNLQIQSSKKQQKSLLHLSEYIGSHFHDIELKAVEQGLYLPSFEKRGVKINGKCVAITRGLSQALLSQSDKSFLSNLETSAKIYERIAQGKQVSEREEREIFAFSRLLNNFERQLDSAANSLPSSLIHTKGCKTFGDLSNYIAEIKGNFAIHLVTSNHVVAIYRTGDNYAYFDSNIAFISGLKSVDQLMKVVEKGVESAGYKVEEKGFLVEHFDVARANNQLPDEDKQVLTKEIKTERQLLAEQDKKFGIIKVSGQELSRVQLYDFGTKVNVEDSVPLLINTDMSLSSKKFQDLIDKEEVSMTAREYLDSLKNSKNIEEVIRATKVIPFMGSKREIEEAEQTRKPKQPLLEQLVKGVINFIASNLTIAFFTNVSQLENQLSEATDKTDNNPKTCLSDITIDDQLRKSLSF